MTNRERRRVRADGYVDVWIPGHVVARKDGYAMEHRVMAWDAGLLTNLTDQVHHKNHRRGDNRLENFEVKTGSDHTREHQEHRGTVTNQYGTFRVKPRHERHSAKYPSCGYVRPERLCARCGESMLKRSDARYCSPRCQVSAWKARNRKNR